MGTLWHTKGKEWPVCDARYSHSTRGNAQVEWMSATTSVNWSKNEHCICLRTTCIEVTWLVILQSFTLRFAVVFSESLSIYLSYSSGIPFVLWIIPQYRWLFNACESKNSLHNNSFTTAFSPFLCHRSMSLQKYRPSYLHNLFVNGSTDFYSLIEQKNSSHHVLNALYITSIPNRKYSSEMQRWFLAMW